MRWKSHYIIHLGNSLNRNSPTNSFKEAKNLLRRFRQKTKTRHHQLEYGVWAQGNSAPFELREGEPLVLRIFVDRSIVEVFANDRQAIARRIYPTLKGNGIKLFSDGDDLTVSSINTWDIMP